MKKIFFPFFTMLIILVSCSERKESASVTSTAPESAFNSADSYTGASAEKAKKGAPSSIPQSPEIKVQPQKKIIKNASIRFEVEDYKETTEQVGKAIGKYNAYINSSRQYNDYRGIVNTMTIRVPSDKFEPLLAELMKESVYLEENSITATDVTDQFVDTEARLKTKREVEKRYLEILRQAKTIQDILAVENQLAAIREEIEAKEGMLKYLNDQVDYSTIHLEYYEKVAVKNEPSFSFSGKILNALQSGWFGLLNFIVALFYVWPFLLIGVVVFFIIRRKLKRRRINSPDHK